MTAAASTICGVLLYGLWKSLLSGDDHREQSKSQVCTCSLGISLIPAQAKWMGLRVMAQGLTFGGLFGFAVYSGRLFSTPEHPLLKANKV